MIDFSDIFMTDFAQLGLGIARPQPQQWAKVKGFPNNMELEVEATFTGGGPAMGIGRGDGVADHRGITVVHPLQPDEDPRFRATTPRAPTTASATS